MKVVIFGATGVIGRAATEHFSTSRAATWSRSHVGRSTCPMSRTCRSTSPTRDATADAVRSPLFRDTTHVVYAALQESTDLAAGWRDTELIERNLDMFRHALEPLAAEHGATLRHVSLLQGAKAYGLHLGRTPVPAKERAPRDQHDNFYFRQEDALRVAADDASWAWTVFRPQVVFGESFGSPMNLVPAIGVYAAIERAAGSTAVVPGRPASVHEAVDARLLARALAWAADAPGARGEIFNVTNGDVYSWHDVWPSIAAVLDMEVGEPQPAAPGRNNARACRGMGRARRPPRSAITARHARVRRRIVGVRRHPLRDDEGGGSCRRCSAR